MKQYHPSPEEEWIQLEIQRELIDKSLDKITIIEKMFFDSGDFDFWSKRHIYRMSIRKMAEIHHMSRYNIRKKLHKINKKVVALRQFFSI